MRTNFLLLVMILILAFFMASIPHLDYQYPIHTDEWWRYGDAYSLLEAGHPAYPDIFDNGAVTDTDIEIGFHLFIGELKLITGLPWLAIFRFLPGLILALLAFLAYAFGRKKGYGLEAAFLVTLIPTTIRLLGPAFLVPVALGITFIPLTLLILQRFMNDFRGPVMLFLMLLSLLFIHPPTLAVISAIILMHAGLFMVWRGKSPGQAKQSVFVLLMFIPIYMLMYWWAADWIGLVTREALSPELHLQLPPIQGAVSEFGYIPALLFLIGTGIIIMRRSAEDWALLLLVVGLLVYLQVYPLFYIGLDIIYERGWLYVFVLMALIGGLALKNMRLFIQPIFARQSLKTAAFTGAIFILAVIMLIISVRNHFSEYYYYLVDDVTYQDFIWIRDNVPEKYQTGILDTNVAWAFAPLTQKFAYTAEVSPNFHMKGRAAMEFLAEGAEDTNWLVERGISIVYSAEEVNTAHLSKVNHNTYLLIND